MASTSSTEPSHQSTEFGFGFGFEIESSFLILASYKLECSLLGLLSVEITSVSYHVHQQNIFIVINETLVFFSYRDSLCSLVLKLYVDQAVVKLTGSSCLCWD